MYRGEELVRLVEAEGEVRGRASQSTGEPDVHWRGENQQYVRRGGLREIQIVCRLRRARVRQIAPRRPKSARDSRRRNRDVETAAHPEGEPLVGELHRPAAECAVVRDEPPDRGETAHRQRP